MPKKGKRRREAQRERREAARAQAEATSLESDAQSASDGEARRAKQREEWQRQKRAQQRAERSAAPIVWIAGAAGVLVVVLVGGYFLLQGDSGSSSSPAPAPTEDPRVAGQTPVQTFEVEAAGAESGSYFAPDSLSANAGEVFEIIITNTGSVSHNMRLSGEDGVYGDDAVPGDDFVSEPYSIRPGETGRLKAVINKPGTYPFQCDFHPETQKGLLTVR